MSVPVEVPLEMEIGFILVVDSSCVRGGIVYPLYVVGLQGIVPASAPSIWLIRTSPVPVLFPSPYASHPKYAIYPVVSTVPRFTPVAERVD